jgi:predicted nucleotidyltransferase
VAEDESIAEREAVRPRPAGDIIPYMEDTAPNGNPPSGRFVLRLPPPLHAALRDAAKRAGLSLNEYCARALSAPGTDPAGPGSAVAARAVAVFGPDLLGVLPYGSWVRGEATPSSDIDVLVVLDAARPITRALYHEWDDTPLEHDGHRIEIHFVRMPSDDDEPGTVWLEAALDGAVAFDRDGRIARYLGRVRREIAAVQ